MRKISMKRKSKADLSSTASTNEDVDNVDNVENVENNEENGQDSAPENNNHSKKRASKKGKKGKKSNPVEESNGTEDQSEDADEEQYEVETVLDQKTVKGVKQFLIRWKGYGSESDTWEPEATLNCQDLIDKFLSSQKSPAKGKKRGSSSASTSKSKKSKADSGSEDDEEPALKKSSKKGKRGDDGGDGEFEVDRILEVHHKKNGKRDFLVHWKGYSANENTWEPEENMNCPDLIEKFMAKVNTARNSLSRELRVDRKPTNHFTLSMSSTGRRLSRRNQGKQRAQYKETE